MKRFLAALLTVLMVLIAWCTPFNAVSAAVAATSSVQPAGEEFWYLYRDFGGSYTGESEHETFYYELDNSGRVQNDGHTFHVYDAAGHETPIPLTYKDFYTDDSFTYQENSKGLVSEFRFFGERGMVYRFYYEDHGLFSGVDECLPEGGVVTSAKFEYDSQFHMFSADYRRNANLQDFYSASSLYTYSYDSAGRLSVLHYTGYFDSVSKDAFAESHTVYQYDADGHLIREITCYGNGEDVDEEYFMYQYVHSYDGQGRLTETRYLHGPDFDPGAPDSVRRYIYDGTNPPVSDVPDPQDPQEVTAQVKLIDASPSSGGLTGDVPPEVYLYFDHEIESINFDKGNIYLCDAQTGEPVYFLDYNGAYKSVRGGSIRIVEDWRRGVKEHRKNCLWWNLPSNMASRISHLEGGHTYYIRIDEGFLSFKDTDEPFAMGFSEQKEWTWQILSDSSMRQEDEVTFHFASSENFELNSEDEKEAKCRFDGSYFLYDSRFYNPHLAVLSIDMALAAYNNFTNYSDGAKYIEEFFTVTGFDQDKIWSNEDYHKKPEDNTAGVAIASRKLSTGATLIAVAIRGGGYEAEWAGNFNVGAGIPQHRGFNLGKEEALRSLSTYIKKYDIEGSIKIWIAGYSRASAITNLTGAALDDGYELPDTVQYGTDDIFAYGFEVPACTTASDAASSRYDNLFSIVNPSDPVPRMPLNQWGFRRYGKVLFLPAPGTDAAYERYKETMMEKFAGIYEAPIQKMPKASQQEHINKMMRDLYEAIQNREIYVAFQDGIMDIVRDTLGKGEYEDGEVAAFLKVIGWISLSHFDYSNGLPVIQRLRNLKDIVLDTVLMDGIKDKTILLPHYAEYTLAWMETLEDTGVLECTEEPSSVSPGSHYGKVMVKYYCPVDIEVYDPDGTLLSSITGDVPFTAETSPVEAYVGEDGAKVFAVPKTAEVSMTVRATGNGSMQIITQCEELLDGSVSKITQYNNLPLVTGEAYRFTLDTGLRGVDYEMTAEDPDGRTLTPDLEAQEDGIPQRTVSVRIRGSGTVSGAGSYPAGTRALLRACPMEGETFEGWFDESGKLIDRSVQIVVSADSDRSITARFSGDDPKESAQPGGFPVWAILLIVLIAAGGITGIVLALVKNLGAPKRVPPR